MNSCTSGRSIVKIPALPTPTKKRKNIRNSQPGTKPSGPGVNTMMPVARNRDRGQDEHGTAADPVAEPTPDERARDRAEAGGQQDRAALPVGERPFLRQRWVT